MHIAKIKHIPFSVCMSVYKNDNTEDFLIAIRSVTIEQTLPPDEVVLIADGPISTSLQKAIDDFSSIYKKINFIQLEKNQGLGVALKTAVERSTYDIIARMDSDDIAEKDRFEKQIAFLEQHPQTTIVGGQIEEFIQNPEQIVGKRIVPCKNADIYAYMKKRCPFNHMTVMFRKQAILDAGNYVELHYNEDYYLWIRMAILHMEFSNLPETIVKVRVGKQMYQRRGGYNYFISEKRIQKYMYQNHLINGWQYIFNVSIRWIIQVVLPNNLRGKLFQLFFRK